MQRFLNWQNVPVGSYSVKAVATETTAPWKQHSVAVNISVNAGPSLYFFHTDHLNTPRAITNTTGQLVWSWANDDPFGANAPNENPSGVGNFTCNLRLPGQYFDKETNLHYNYYRDYDSEIGRYVQSDPIGLVGGINTYSYAYSNPLGLIDPDGLEVRLVCRRLAGRLLGATGGKHCFVYVTCPEEHWSRTFSLFRDDKNSNLGYKAADSFRDWPNPEYFSGAVKPNMCPVDRCGFEKAVVNRFNSFSETKVPYHFFSGPNSNTFAESLATGTVFGGALPSDAPQWPFAPGFNMRMPGFQQ